MPVPYERRNEIAYDVLREMYRRNPLSLHPDEFRAEVERLAAIAGTTEGVMTEFLLTILEEELAYIRVTSPDHVPSFEGDEPVEEDAGSVASSKTGRQYRH